MSLIQQINALATKCAQEDQANSAAAAAALAAAQAAQASADNALQLGGAAYHYKGTVADMAALNALDTSTLEVGDVYNVGADLSGGNYAWNGNSWDSLGKSFTVANSIGDLSSTALVPEGLVVDALAGKVDTSDVGDTTTDFVATYTAAYTAAANPTPAP